MSFIVYGEDIDRLLSSVSSYYQQVEKAVSAIGGGVDSLSSLEGFTGATAESVKAYFAEVHGSVLQAMVSLLREALTRAGLYDHGYFAIDAAKSFHLEDGTLSRVSNQVGGFRHQAQDLSDGVQRALMGVADLLDVPVPSVAAADRSLGASLALVVDTLDKVQAHESASQRSVADLDEFCHVLEVLLGRLSAHPTGGVGYQPGSVAALEEFKPVVDRLVGSQQYVKDYAPVLQEADADWQARAKAWQHDEAVESRRNEGILQLINGGVGVAIDLAAIFLCEFAGPAAPLVVAAAVADLPFSASEAVEGGDKVKLAHSGDADSLAFNPMRDWAFGGDQQSYDVANAYVQVAGIFVGGVGAADAAAKNAVILGISGKDLKVFKTVETLQALSIDATGSIVIPQAVTMLQEKYFGNSPVAQQAGRLVGTLLGGGFLKIKIKTGGERDVQSMKSALGRHIADPNKGSHVHQSPGIAHDFKPVDLSGGVGGHDAPPSEHVSAPVPAPAQAPAPVPAPAPASDGLAAEHVSAPVVPPEYVAPHISGPVQEGVAPVPDHVSAPVVPPAPAAPPVPGPVPGGSLPLPDHVSAPVPAPVEGEPFALKTAGDAASGRVKEPTLAPKSGKER
ncbi:hypothetical protein KIM372_06220 [Bombiscardovia nodaiensis]|uniref:LXG domain-containing protein n=1 Tax=Bombiscardovia nodaiensis TaxID=2932181 RepID=A0ABM8B778_9BIFI|nr:hypothetical protein KIM372_06220 [Bombiscardovia nodaiensis]